MFAVSLRTQAARPIGFSIESIGYWIDPIEYPNDLIACWIDPFGYPNDSIG
jgi:hypothetical protein